MKTAAAFFLVIFAFVIASAPTEQEQIIADIHYCNMVDIWKSEAHKPPVKRHGHPDYKKQYDLICK